MLEPTVWLLVVTWTSCRNSEIPCKLLSSEQHLEGEASMTLKSYENLRFNYGERLLQSLKKILLWYAFMINCHNKNFIVEKL